MIRIHFMVTECYLTVLGALWGRGAEKEGDRMELSIQNTLLTCLHTVCKHKFANMKMVVQIPTAL